MKQNEEASPICRQLAITQERGVLGDHKETDGSLGASRQLKIKKKTRVRGCMPKIKLKTWRSNQELKKSRAVENARPNKTRGRDDEAEIPFPLQDKQKPLGLVDVRKRGRCA